METSSFENHSKIEELNWMIGFTSSELHLFIFGITEQIETNIFPRKQLWKIPGTLNKVEKKITKK